MFKYKTKDPADFIFFVTQEQYDAEVRQARIKEARVGKRKEIVAKLSSSSTENSPRRRSSIRTRSQELALKFRDH